MASRVAVRKSSPIVADNDNEWRKEAAHYTGMFEAFASFFDFFASLFSFMVIIGFFLASLLVFRGLVMAFAP